MIGPTDKLKGFITGSPIHDRWIDVIELSHPALTQSFVLAPIEQPVTVRFEDGRQATALPIGLRVDLPDAGTNGRQDMSVSIDNVGAEVWAALETASTMAEFPVQIAWRVFLESDLSIPQAPPVLLTVTTISVTETVVSLQATRVDIINRKWPFVVYRPDRFPGLNR